MKARRMLGPLRRLRPGLRTQIAAVVWLAVMGASAGAQGLTTSAMLDSLNAADESAHDRAVATLRADWLANPKASAAAFGRSHSVHTWDFAVWQVKTKDLTVADDGAESGIVSYWVPATLRAPDWDSHGTWDEPTSQAVELAGPRTIDDRLTTWTSGGPRGSFLALLDQGKGNALLVSESYAGADWSSYDLLRRNLSRQAWVMSIVAALGAWLLSGLLMRPAQRAAAVARRIGAGELSARVSTPGGDEIGQLGRALNDMADDLQRMIGAQRHFVSDTAHELRTPTAALLASASALENPATRDEAAGQVVPQLRRLSSLTEDLLALARFDNDREERDDQVVDLVDLTTRAAAQVAGEADVRVDADGPVFVIVDAARVATIVRNLVGNALRHGAEPVRMVVSEKDGQALVRVDDAGRGVPEDLRETIFDRFVRGDDARHGEGAGLGLAIARENAELHGGTLRLNDDGHGFVLALPVESTPAPARVPVVVEIPKPSLVRQWADEAVGGLFSIAMVLLIGPRLGLGAPVQTWSLLPSVVITLGTVAAVMVAKHVTAALRPEKWAPTAAGLATLLAVMTVTTYGYRASVAAAMGVGWAAWQVLDRVVRRR